MARTRVDLNPAGVRALLNSDKIGAEILRRAERVAHAARSTAPVQSGKYRDSIKAELATTDRKVGRVVSDVSYAFAVEARTGNLARALDSAGGS